MLIGFVCPVPPNGCSGPTLAAGPGAGVRKYHGGREEVRRCEHRYLIRQGYEQVDSRTYRAPAGTRQRERGLLVLDAKPGIPVRTGKGKRPQADRSKHMPVAMW